MVEAASNEASGVISRTGTDHPVVGHAIVTADGMIADAQGLMPPPLRNEADWALFQAALDRASIVVVGSLGHRRHPNPGRRRLVFTSAVETFEADPADPLTTLFNPATVAIATVLDAIDLPGGAIAVTGGRRVFDHFLALYDSFMLAEVGGSVLPGGVPCFSTGHPRTVLAAAGLLPGDRAAIDPANGVDLTRWSSR
jgi:dihydrofolate reductase